MLIWWRHQYMASLAEVVISHSHEPVSITIAWHFDAGSPARVPTAPEPADSQRGPAPVQAIFPPRHRLHARTRSQSLTLGRQGTRPKHLEFWRSGTPELPTN